MILEKTTIRKIAKNRKKLESKLNLKIIIKGEEAELSGSEIDIFVGERVLNAIEKNFPIDSALLLTNESYFIEEISIKSIRAKNLPRIKSRLIGTRGKTLKLISELSDCKVALYENIISIIGEADKMKIAVNAVKSLIKGSRQTNVYSYLEKHKKIDEQDLELKE